MSLCKADAEFRPFPGFLVLGAFLGLSVDEVLEASDVEIGRDLGDFADGCELGEEVFGVFEGEVEEGTVVVACSGAGGEGALDGEIGAVCDGVQGEAEGFGVAGPRHVTLIFIWRLILVFLLRLRADFFIGLVSFSCFCWFDWSVDVSRELVCE